jgi:ABC-type transport system involved in Fe-S cluster assembly fused permease/ATPase subunit
VLFHDTIYYNIHYGNVQATEEQVYYMKMLWPKSLLVFLTILS